jgi:hypothetical protein
MMTRPSRPASYSVMRHSSDTGPHRPGKQVAGGLFASSNASSTAREVVFDQLARDLSAKKTRPQELTKGHGLFCVFADPAEIARQRTERIIDQVAD